MTDQTSLYTISKLLLSEGDSENLAQALLQRLLEATGAVRGFIVVREGRSYEQKFDVHFNREEVSDEERKFSRSLVRRALENDEILYSPRLSGDARFAGLESVQVLGDRSVLVAPLRHAGEAWGVVYLERRGQFESFSAQTVEFLTEFSELAGLFLRRAAERQSLVERSLTLERELFARYNFEGIVTGNSKMVDLLKTVAQVADSDASVVIRGETGTGKELIARALHYNSGRKSRPFVTIHCSALPGTILESELFGHVRGAFTGAERDRPGRIASAAGGTLVLDEVGEIPLEIQVKLLRFLQSGEIQRLGSDRVEKVDVRILAATHRDLAEMVKSGKFRQDLYYRLRVLELRIPPLRERRDDVPLLLAHFTRRHWRREGEVPRWTSRAEDALREYGYPGNVRELEHMVERACLLATESKLDVDLLPAEVVGNTAEAARFEDYTNEELKAARKEAVATVERQFLQGLLERCGGNVSKAARESGVHRTYLQKLLSDQKSTSQVRTAVEQNEAETQ